MLKYPSYKGRNYKNITQNNISAALKLSYEELFQNHISDYKAYFDRVCFRLGNYSDSIPSDVLVKQAKTGKVNSHLYELMFHYGRYILISSSRPGTSPANLQGIWANKLQTPWNGDYHTDINLEMNYWMSGPVNLSEMQLPMFDLVSSLVKPGRITAQIQYGKKGWVVHPITNIWGYTSPGEQSSWGMHTGAAAWLCQHIGEHFRFTGDKNFLESMFSVLKGAVEFYLDWLCVDPSSGKLVSGPAVSPENTFLAPDGIKCQISMGPTHDQQAIWQLFDDYEMAARVLGLNDSFNFQVKKAKCNLAGIRIGSDGRIMEWGAEYPEIEPGHRHIKDDGKYIIHLLSALPDSWKDGQLVEVTVLPGFENKCSILYKNKSFDVLDLSGKMKWSWRLNDEK